SRPRAERSSSTAISSDRTATKRWPASPHRSTVAQPSTPARCSTATVALGPELRPYTRPAAVARARVAEAAAVGGAAVDVAQQVAGAGAEGMEASSLTRSRTSGLATP